jgi:hypothetical protein
MLLFKFFALLKRAWRWTAAKLCGLQRFLIKLALDFLHAFASSSQIVHAAEKTTKIE